ncbi:unnamed protein product [Phytomonas sp. EM1]|nr:unnamed protein product [Phytomonas sp. EM1]|eukprot:CCW65043.1 unnamed protein product [Phytomonas sp. isolate EM1]
MSVSNEVYAEGRRSVRESMLHYVAQRMTVARTTAISERGRFWILVLGVYSCICASTGFVYNLFSGDLQKKYNFSQSDMTTITTVSGILSIVAFPLAIVYDHYGPRPLFIVGTIAFPLGSVLFAMALKDMFQGSVTLFILFSTLQGVGNSMFDIAGLMTVMSVFPSSRGAVIVVMKTFIGLGSAVLGAIQMGFYENNVIGFFNFMAAFVFIVGILSAIFIRLPPYELTRHDESHLSEAEKRKRIATKRAYFEQVPPFRRFAIGYILVGIISIFLTVQSTLVAYVDLSHTYKMAFAIITILFLLMYTVIALPIRWLDGGSDAIIERIRNSEATFESSVISPRQQTTSQALQRASARMSAILASTRGSIREESVFRMPIMDESEHIAPQYQSTFMESLFTLKLWALSYSLFCIIGAQGVIIMNARFIYASISGKPIHDEMATLLTVINGTGSGLGRILMGIFEVWTQKRKPEERIPLTISLHIPTIAMLLASSLLLVVSEKYLLIPFILTALGNGFIAAINVLVIRTIYVKDIANHYNFTSIASLAASIFINKMLYGDWYTKEAEKQGSTICYGRECIFVPFLVMSLLVASGIASNYYVHYQYQSYCNAVLEERKQSRDPITETVIDDNIGESQPLLQDAQL